MNNRWIQLSAGVIGMVAVANLQYGWTLFVEPIRDRHGWRLDEVQLAFSLFLIAETWLVPIETFLADRLGPRPVLVAGGILAGLSWTVNAYADTLWMLYAGNVMAGMGAGMVYGVSIGNALKWFPDRRGLAAGITAAAWGAGAALTVIPMRRLIAEAGYEDAFLGFGLGIGLIVLIVAGVLRGAPDLRTLPKPSPRMSSAARDYRPVEMLRTPTFWLIYVMMTMVSVGGLLALPNVAPMAKSLGLDEYPFELMGWSISALSLALMLERVLNGVTRPFFGWISDHIGREWTMGIAFSAEGVAILLWMKFAEDPLLFVLFSGLTFFGWGEVYSLFPALLTDMFGGRYATTNYAILYTAKGTASLFVYLGTRIYSETGDWMAAFAMAIAFDWLTALLAVFVLRPLRNKVPEQRG